jgi:hypothetical protein
MRSAAIILLLGLLATLAWLLPGNRGIQGPISVQQATVPDNR